MNMAIATIYRAVDGDAAPIGIGVTVRTGTTDLHYSYGPDGKLMVRALPAADRAAVRALSEELDRHVVDLTVPDDLSGLAPGRGPAEVPPTDMGAGPVRRGWVCLGCKHPWYMHPPEGVEEMLPPGRPAPRCVGSASELSAAPLPENLCLCDRRYVP